MTLVFSIMSDDAQPPSFSKAQLEQFKKEHQDMVNRLNSPEAQKRLKRVNIDRPERTREPRAGTWSTRPGESFDDSVERWKQGFIATHPNLDARAKNEHTSRSELLGVKISSEDSAPKAPPLQQPVTSILEMFMPVIPMELQQQEDDVNQILSDLGFSKEEEMQEDDADGMTVD